MRTPGALRKLRVYTFRGLTCPTELVLPVLEAAIALPSLDTLIVNESARDVPDDALFPLLEKSSWRVREMHFAGSRRGKTFVSQLGKSIVRRIEVFRGKHHLFFQKG